jgi:DNA-binding NtrC family response regulator
MRSNKQTARLLTGVAALFRLEHGRARKLLQPLVGQLQTAGNHREEVVCLEYLGLNEFFAGNYDKAGQYYADILSRNQITASASAQTLRMLTDLEIAVGDFTAARETAVKAEAAITRINERIELGALYRARALIAEHDGQCDPSGQLLTKSIELLERIGARYELALSHLVAGRAGVFSRDERQEHLSRARELFAEMEVERRIAEVNRELAHLDSGPSSTGAAGKEAAPTIIAGSAAMRELLEIIERVRDTDMTILLTGETGTGKDLLARYIHETSRRASGPWIAFNAAAIPDNLLEAELFGHTGNSFTGARRSRQGLIAAADGGTCFLDEIAEIPVSLQVKLLRVLETRQIRRLGQNEGVAVDVRFIAATNQSLGQRLSEGAFRADLYFRLQQVPLHLPPLRERREDLESLIRFFLTRQGVTASELEQLPVADLLHQLEGYSWPGNIRELATGIERAVALWRGDDNSSLESHLGQQLGRRVHHRSEKETILEALLRHRGNRSRTAVELGIPEATLRYRLKKMNM